MPRKGTEAAISERSYRLADGSMSRTYSVRYFDRNGVRRRVACASREEADFERARIVLEQTRGIVTDTAGPAPATSLTVAEFWTDLAGRRTQPPNAADGARVRTDLQDEGRSAVRHRRSRWFEAANDLRVALRARPGWRGPRSDQARDGPVAGDVLLWRSSGARRQPTRSLWSGSPGKDASAPSRRSLPRVLSGFERSCLAVGAASQPRW